MDQNKELSTLEEIKAFSDPYRLQILTTIREFNRPCTVKEVADVLHETPAKVHYHVKKLEKLDILRLVETKEINGIIAKYYSPTAERFTLKSTETNTEVKKVILNETQRAINHIYDKSKNHLFKQMNQSESQEAESASIIYTSNLYLNQSDVDELTALLTRFTTKKVTDEERKNSSYHLFTVFFKNETNKE